MWGFTVCIFSLLAASAATGTTGHYEDCYHITTGIMIAIVAGDVALTLLFLIPVYYCIRPKGSKNSDSGEMHSYVNVIGMNK
ncbi:hematopoietic cell signal transducer-like [Podarcis lilfordi]|uniref:Hematopoietic cell signal transducer-like n=1 Tax=Podarcis lilfordi TaxID=74358 RepID=A0AA35PCZ4_9SAUR|nr:hematopoietic cell signal transducer-like [Podarcis lilfordi]